MFYPKVEKTADPQRTAQRLLALKQAMQDSGIPKKCVNHALIATWNIREFDSKAYGARSLEALYYIAEICSQFDLIAVQEVREDLSALKQVQRLLGSGWKYIVTDVTEGKAGNRERMAYLYDDGKVNFTGIAGEVVIPPVEERVAGQKKIKYKPADQLFRTPYLCGFQIGWTKLMLCTVHILYGKDKKDNPKRVSEIKAIADFLARRSRERKDYSHLVLLGDFNIYNTTDVTMDAITDAGFRVPDALQEVPATNVGKIKRHYDQIAYMPRKFNIEFTGKAGVFDYFETVFKEEDQQLYIADMGPKYNVNTKKKRRDAAGKKRYYKTYWRTHQMSDHLPMWAQIRTDFSEEYLRDRWE